jgi:defect in organelle trafficking protein DotD
MKHRIAAISSLCLVLSACANPTPPPQQKALSQADNSMAEASYSVSRSIVDLAETAQAAHPTAPLTPPPSPASYGMGGVTTIDWSGPVEPLVQQMAKATNYRMRVLGTRPAIPVIVTVNTRNTMMGDILRDVGYQCGERASVVVFPESRVIELRYAKN